MLSFEFSAFDLILSVGVVVLIILFVATLLRLNPSNEDKKSRKETAHEEEQEFIAPSHRLGQQNDQQNVPYTAQGTEKATVERVQQPPQLVVSATTRGYSQESLEQTSKQIEHKEPIKNHKTASSQKQAPKTSSDKDCFHFFGYLGGLPKNTPIPGECFGCEKIVDCLITVKGKS